MRRSSLTPAIRLVGCFAIPASLLTGLASLIGTSPDALGASVAGSLYALAFLGGVYWSLGE